MVCANSILLKSGNMMPLLGFGTYMIPDSDAGVEAVAVALDHGYRLLDCASFYRNETAVGKALCGRNRRELFIISKVWNSSVYSGRRAVRESCLKSIRDLNCEYLDLYLIHWPVPGHHVQAYLELIELKKDGFIKDVGVSNYTSDDIDALISAGITDLPVVNQIEVNPFLFRKRTIEYGKEHGILPMSYRGLCGSKRLNDENIVKAANELGVTSAQLLGKWLVDQGICHIPKSMKEARIKENADIYSFDIPDHIKQVLDHLTSEENLHQYKSHYVNRITLGTPIEPPLDMTITLD